MRNSDSISILTETERVVSKHSQELFALLRTSVCDSPNFLDKYLMDLILPRTKDDILRLIVLLNFQNVPDEFDCLLRVELEDRLNKVNEISWMKILLDPNILRVWLLENHEYSTRDWFGNILNENKLSKLVKSLRFKKRSRYIKKVQRKRGYTDKGSLKPRNKLPGELKSTYLEPKELEEIRLLHYSTLDLIEGMLM